jgi:putative addiction module killer protein
MLKMAVSTRRSCNYQARLRHLNMRRDLGCNLTFCNRSITIDDMFLLKPLPEFTQWVNSLKDVTVRSVVIARLKRLELGLLGDVASVGAGVSELRIHLGAGWRVYYTQRGDQIIVLLAGGSKRTQQRDIDRAKALAALLDE